MKLIYPGGSTVITRVLKSASEKQKRERGWKIQVASFVDGERGMSQAKQVICRSWKRQENRFFPLEPPERDTDIDQHLDFSPLIAFGLLTSEQ